MENKKIDLTTNNPHAFDASRNLKRHPRIDYESRVFCWDLVLDCDTTRSKLCGIDNKLRAVEMEAGGFLRSLELFSKKMEYTISGLIFRGLSDQASNKTSTDEETTVKWREFAARNAATVMVEFIDDLREKDFAVGLERQAEPPAKTYAVAPGEIRTL